MKKEAEGASKSVQNVKNSLKFKAQERDGILSVRVGVKKFSLPMKARMLNNGEYLFLSFPASSELYRIASGNLVPMERDEDASVAYEALNPGRRSRRRGGNGVDVPVDLAEALKAIPSGYKLGYSADGVPKLIRTRKRGKKA